MAARQRSARLALLGLLGLLTAGLASSSLDGLWAGPRPVPGRTAQGPFPATPEPPLPGPHGTAAPLPGPGPEGMPFPVDPPVPVVAIRVRVAASVSAGQEVEYRIAVENRSRGAAHHVLVRNPLPANARFVRANPEPTAREPELLWTLGTLEGCTSREIVLVLAPAGGGEIRNCARVQFEHGQCVTTRVAGPSLRLGKRGPTEAGMNAVLTFQLAVANPNDFPVNDVVLTDTLPDGLEHPGGTNPLSWSVGTLAPGQVRSIEYQAVARKEGRLCNRAVVTAAGGIREEAVSCVTVGMPSLDLIKEGPPQSFVNLAAAYRITVRNRGALPLTNVRITDTLPDQTTLAGASAGARLSGNQVQWLIGRLEPNASRTVGLTLRAQTTGRFRNVAVATADRGLSRQAEAETEFVGQPGLNMDVEDTDPVEVGKQGRYVVRVRNTGFAAATNVRIVATVPEEMTVKSVAGPANVVKGRTVHFEGMTLQPGKDVVYEINVAADRAGEVRFRVELTTDQFTRGPVRAEESTTIFAQEPPVR